MSLFLSESSHGVLLANSHRENSPSGALVDFVSVNKSVAYTGEENLILS